MNYKLNLGLVLVGGVHAVQVLIESRDMAANKRRRFVAPMKAKQVARFDR